MFGIFIGCSCYEDLQSDEKTDKLVKAYINLEKSFGFSFFSSQMTQKTKDSIGRSPLMHAPTMHATPSPTQRNACDTDDNILVSAEKRIMEWLPTPGGHNQTTNTIACNDNDNIDVATMDPNKPTETNNNSDGFFSNLASFSQQSDGVDNAECDPRRNGMENEAPQTTCARNEIDNAQSRDPYSEFNTIVEAIIDDSPENNLVVGQTDNDPLIRDVNKVLNDIDNVLNNRDKLVDMNINFMDKTSSPNVDVGKVANVENAPTCKVAPKLAPFQSSRKRITKSVHSCAFCGTKSVTEATGDIIRIEIPNKTKKKNKKMGKDQSVQDSSPSPSNTIIYVHEMCALWSPNCYEDPSDGMKIKNVDSELRRRYEVKT